MQEILQAVFALLDEQIRITKANAERFGKQDADGAFAAGGHADQNDIAHQMEISCATRYRSRSMVFFMFSASKMSKSTI